MSNMIVSFDNVTKEYMQTAVFEQGIKGFFFNLHKHIQHRSSNFKALSNVSFDVNKGEFIALIGRNGAGKSTALGLIAGVLHPTTGKVSVNGRIAPLLELGAGFHSDLTGRENILVNGVLLGLTRQEVRAKMDEIIEFSGLGDFIEQPMRTYSTGMYMRLGFSVAVSINPDILLVDEVLAVGDEPFQKQCMDKMAEFKSRGATIILVTHSLGDAEKLCDRAILLHHGQVASLGKPKDVYEHYRTRIN